MTIDAPSHAEIFKLFYFVHFGTDQGRMLLSTVPKELVNGTSATVNTVYETSNNWLDNPKDILGQILVGIRFPPAMCYPGNNILVAAGGKVFVSPDERGSWVQVWSHAGSIVSICVDPFNPFEIYFAAEVLEIQLVRFFILP